MSEEEDDYVAGRPAAAPTRADDKPGLTTSFRDIFNSMLFTQAPFDSPITDDSGNLLKDGDVIAELHTTESIKAFAERIIVRARKLNVEVIVHRSFHGSKKEGKPGQQHFKRLRSLFFQQSIRHVEVADACNADFLDTRYHSLYLIYTRTHRRKH